MHKIPYQQESFSNHTHNHTGTSNHTQDNPEQPPPAQARIAELEARLAQLEAEHSHAQQYIAELEARTRTNSQTSTMAMPSARLDTLLAISASLLVTHEIEPLLDLVVREASTLFPCQSRAVLFLRHPERQRLSVRSFAPGQEDVHLTTVPRQADVNRHLFLAPRAMLMESSELLNLLSQSQLDVVATHIVDTPARAAAQTSDPAAPPRRSVLLAPLRTESQYMGALIMCTNDAQRSYHPHDLAFIQALADLAAVAIVEIHQRERAAALELDLAKTRLLHKQAQLQLDTAQAQLLQSAKLAAVGELAASVAHEINNPLYAARNSLYLLEQDLPADLPQKQFLDIAQSELGRISRIITRMRDFYRPDRAELLQTDVNNLLRDTVDFVRTYLRHGHIQVTSELAHQLPTLTAHVDQLRQVFLNIVLNACDAMPSGGSLSITTSVEPTSSGREQNLVIRIADTGIGIPDEHLSHLFEPFYTTKPQGTGLGLAICAHIVTQHSGQIFVDSAVNQGTTFTITLPVVADGSEPDAM